MKKQKNFEGFVSGHNACAGCGSALAMRHILKIAGPNTIVTIATGCMEVVSTVYPLTAWKVPCIHSAFENTAATASGIEAALKKQGKKINVIAIAGDGGTFDIGLQALSGMLERGHRVLYICYDNEAYMNTGIQRSGATPLHADTTTSPFGSVIHGKLEVKKNMPFLVASHGNVYVATASIGYLEDFKSKLKKALEHIHRPGKEGGPAYIQVLCPCIPGWKIPSNITIKLAKQAVNSKVYLLFEIENGRLKLQEFPEEKLENYLKVQGRFSHLKEKDIIELKKIFEKNYQKLKKISDSGINTF
ncbi:MAG: thiamine pyrophosphate-dependent enzyme [Candidatus Pacearchaeota archaeon]